MKILLLNQTFYPDVVSTAQYLSELASALQERGHEVTVVTGRRAYDNSDRVFPARETWRGVKIYRVFATRFGKAAKWRRAMDFISFILSGCVRLLFLPRQDVVMALTSPPLISFIGAWRAKLWGARFCYWVMDMNPDEAIAAGWLNPNSTIAKMLERMSRFSFHQASFIIALDRFMQDRILAKGIPKAKTAVIPPWSQDHDVRFDAAGRERFRQQHGLMDKYVVMYSGNHSPVHPMNTMMAAADCLAHDPGIVFCFVGGGSEFKRIKQWQAEGKRANVLCLPYQPLSELAGSLSAADAHAVVMGDAMLGIVHPSKVYNMLAVGAPVVYIGPKESHVTEILDRPGQEHLWCSARHGEGARLAEEIQTLRRVRANRQAFDHLTGQFAKAVLLPKIIAGMEQKRLG